MCDNGSSSSKVAQFKVVVHDDESYVSYRGTIECTFLAMLMLDS